MPLKAFCEELNKQVLSFQLPEDLTKPQEYTWVCPSCDKQMSWVDSTLKIKHFRHKSSAECGYAKESIAHLKTKQFLYEQLKNYNNTSFIDIEHNLENKIRPDVYLETNNGKYAIEVQYSGVSFNSWLEKTLNYSDKNIACTWICSPPTTIQKFEELNIHSIRLNQLQKINHWLNFGRFYWMSLEENTIKATHIKYRSKCCGNASTISLKNLYLHADWNTIPSLKFFNTENLNETEVLMGRFTDKKWW